LFGWFYILDGLYVLLVVWKCVVCTAIMMWIYFCARENGELYWTRPGEQVGRSKRKLSLKQGALTWARTATAHSPLFFEGLPKRRPLAWARAVSLERVGLAWVRPRCAPCCSLGQARAGSLSEEFLSPKRGLFSFSEIWHF